MLNTYSISGLGRSIKRRKSSISSCKLSKTKRRGRSKGRSRGRSKGGFRGRFRGRSRGRSRGQV
jgi:hypothetical protein